MIPISKRDYHMLDAELCVFTSNLVGTMTRDLVQFTLRGVTALQISAMETLGNAFELFPPDSYYQADISIVVNEKIVQRNSAEKMIRAIVGCAKIKWGVNSAQVRKFGAGAMTRDDDKKFLTTSRQVVTTGTGFLIDLTPVGLTQTMLDELDDKAQDFEDSLNLISSKTETRDLKTQERITKGNELYGFVVQYCEIGKIIWEDVDEAKYNDYVIYKPEHPGLSKPQNLAAEYIPGPPATINLTWDDVQLATNYDVFVSIREIGHPSGTFNFLDNFPTNSAAVPAELNKRNYFKIKARNDTQVSDYSDEVFVDVTI